MKVDNPFDNALSVQGIPVEIKQAAIAVTDTLDLSWKSAQAIFEDKATPEIALEIYDRIITELKKQTISNYLP